MLLVVVVVEVWLAPESSHSYQLPVTLHWRASTHYIYQCSCRILITSLLPFIHSSRPLTMDECVLCCIVKVWRWLTRIWRRIIWCLIAGTFSWFSGDTGRRMERSRGGDTWHVTCGTRSQCGGKKVIYKSCRTCLESMMYANVPSLGPLSHL